MPERTPDERRNALRAGAHHLTRVTTELGEASWHFDAAGYPAWSDRLRALQADLAAMASHARNEAGREEGAQ